MFGVPYSMKVGERTVIHGSISCLVREGDRVTVVELANGGETSEDEKRLGLSVDAARAMWPGALVDGLLVASTQI